MIERATGTLTFLFTDVEGSTPLWERHEAAMRAVTARHDALLAAIIAAHGGTRVRERGEGDSLFAVFASPADAVAAALAIARAVLAEPWPPETPIRIRMGLHTGSAQLRAGDYYGPVVNRCARIRGLGHGGQVLLSAATAALVQDGLPAGAGLRALGAHSLKGLSEPEAVYQLCHPELPGEFPPLLSPQAPRHNLPQALSRLIGREAEQGEVLALLAEARLVTLTGSGGVGKTRLGLAVAAELVDQYPDGVWLAELASLTEPSLIPGAVAQALGVREEPGRALTTTLQDALKDKRLLLVLDNCEHLVAACAALASALLRACPHLRLLATSREGLEVAGEQRWRVPSLSLPDLHHLPPPELTGSYEAVRLFVARARERRPDFALTSSNARAVASICARLDGIPLAIELAAARVDSLGVEGIAARLDDRFALLTGGPRDALPRQRTLRAALDWSYDLLTEPEQALLDRLSVFVGGCTLAAAEAVCAGDGIEQERLGGSDDLAILAKWEILDLLGSLVNKSLVQAEEAGGEVRYGLLETVRQYGKARLDATGANDALRASHVAYYLTMAESAAPLLSGPQQFAWLQLLERDHDNVRAALEWAILARPGETALRLAIAFSEFWRLRSYYSEGRRWLGHALEAAGPTPTSPRGWALYQASELAIGLDDGTQGVALAESALAVARDLGDERLTAYALRALSSHVLLSQNDARHAATLYMQILQLAHALGDRQLAITCLYDLGQIEEDPHRALQLFEDALALALEAGDQWSRASIQMLIGTALLALNRLSEASDRLESALFTLRPLGNKRTLVECLLTLSRVVQLQGDHERALALAHECLVLGRSESQVGWITSALVCRGHLAEVEAAYAGAEQFYEECLTLCRHNGHHRFAALCLLRLAAVARVEGHVSQAVMRIEEARVTCTGRGAVAMDDASTLPYVSMVAAVRDDLKATIYILAWTQGRAIPPVVLEHLLD